MLGATPGEALTTPGRATAGVVDLPIAEKGTTMPARTTAVGAAAAAGSAAGSAGGAYSGLADKTVAGAATAAVRRTGSVRDGVPHSFT